jgi:hypothetical protein
MPFTVYAAMLACVLFCNAEPENDYVSLLQSVRRAVGEDDEKLDTSLEQRVSHQGKGKGKSTSCQWGDWEFTTNVNNGDLVGILKGPSTGTGMTEVHILSAASNYQSWVLQTGTALQYTDDNWAFAMKTNNDLVGILKGPLTGSGTTEVHILSAASNYKSWVLQAGTALQYTDDNWAFALKTNGDLVGILKGPLTGSGTTELHILSAASNYQSFVLQTGTALQYTDDNWAFSMDGNDNLVGILKGPVTGSGTTEVHTLSAASNYQTWVLQTGTALGYTDDNWAFTAKGNGDVMAILKGPTSGTGTTEAHILSAASNYQTWVLHTGTALHYTVCAPTPAPTPTPTPAPTFAPTPTPSPTPSPTPATTATTTAPTAPACPAQCQKEKCKTNANGKEKCKLKTKMKKCQKEQCQYCPGCTDNDDDDET